MGFKYIELFAGIGGFRSALDPLGGECVFASEIDPFATRAYKALYDGASELHGDITKIDAHDIPDHDVLVGGFPCQAFSVAGQRKGFEEARGTLFFEIARIASAKQPRFMLLENVKGLLSHDGGNTFETMCAVLNDIGYAIDFNVLNSKFFAVPQNRERIFIMCKRDEALDAEWDVKGTGVVAKAKCRAQALGIRTFNFDWPTDDTVATRLRDVLESNVDERYYLSDEKTARLVAELADLVPSDECEMIGHVDGINGHDICRRVYSPTGVAPTIPTGSSGNTTPKIAVIGHLPSDSGQTGTVYGADGIAPTLLNQHGNAVTKIAIDAFGATPDGCSYCLTTRYDNGFLPSMFARKERTAVIEEFSPNVKQRYRIRKLTPLECWRLQGFTDVQHAKVVSAGISDSQRYKQAGNAVTVNVISAIGKRLIPLLSENITEVHA